MPHSGTSLVWFSLFSFPGWCTYRWPYVAYATLQALLQLHDWLTTRWCQQRQQCGPSRWLLHGCCIFTRKSVTSVCVFFLMQAGVRTGDRMWRLPLFEHYRSPMVEHGMADVNNIGNAGFPGMSCTAAGFLWVRQGHGPVLVTKVIWRCRKPFSQWKHSFHLKAVLPLAEKLVTT